MDRVPQVEEQYRDVNNDVDVGGIEGYVSESGQREGLGGEVEA